VTKSTNASGSATSKAAAKSAAPAPKGKGLWQLNRDLEAIEADIATLEAELERAHLALAQPAPDADFAVLGKAAHDLETRLEARMDDWARVQEEIEARS